MENIELLVFLLEKKIGPLKKTDMPAYKDSRLYALEFMHQQMILNIILIETKPHHWIIHHELSKENPFLLKKIARICERIQRITEGKNISFSLSDDLKEILKQNYLNLVVKCSLQNMLLKYFTLYKSENKIKNGDKERGFYLYRNRVIQREIKKDAGFSFKG